MQKIKSMCVLVTLLTIIAILASCVYTTSPVKNKTFGHVLFHLSEGDATPDIDIAYYRITGTGPNNHTIDLTTDLDDLTVDRLATGNWDIVVYTYNINGFTTGQAASTITVTNGDVLDLDVVPMSLIDTGHIDIQLRWNDSDFTDPSYSITFIPLHGDSLDLVPDPIPVQAPYNVVQTSQDIPEGYYASIISFYDEQEFIAGTIEVNKLVKDKPLVRQFHFSNNQKGTNSSLTFNLEDQPSDRLMYNILGLEDEVLYDKLVLIGAEIDSNYTKMPVIGNIVKVWFLDGKFYHIGSGASFIPQTYDLNPGQHELTLRTFTADGKRTGVTKMNFNVVEKVTTPTPTPTLVNIAIDKTVKATSTFTLGATTYHASNIVDDDPDTAWGSTDNTADEDWLYIDLGKEYRIYRYEIIWFEGYHATSYRVGSAGENKSFEDVYIEENGDGQIDSNDIDYYSRYIGIHFYEGVKSQYAIKEFKVYAYETDLVH